MSRGYCLSCRVRFRQHGTLCHKCHNDWKLRERMDPVAPLFRKFCLSRPRR